MQHDSQHIPSQSAEIDTFRIHLRVFAPSHGLDTVVQRRTFFSHRGCVCLSGLITITMPPLCLGENLTFPVRLCDVCLSYSGEASRIYRCPYNLQGISVSGPLIDWQPTHNGLDSRILPGHTIPRHAGGGFPVPRIDSLIPLDT